MIKYHGGKYVLHNKKNDCISHHGILGQKWGVRRYQNPDGTLTVAGKKRYSRMMDQVWQSQSQEERNKRYGDHKPTNSSLRKKNVEKLNKANLDINDFIGDSKGDLGDAQLLDYLKRAGVKFNDRLDAHHVSPRKLNMSSDEDNWIKLNKEVSMKSGDWYFGANMSKGRKKIAKEDHQIREDFDRDYKKALTQKGKSKAFDTYRQKSADLQYREAGVALRDMNYEDTDAGRKFLVENNIIRYD